MPRKDNETPAKPDNAKTPADPFGKPGKKSEWTREAMDEEMRKPHLDGNDDKVAEHDRNAEKE